MATRQEEQEIRRRARAEREQALAREYGDVEPPLNEALSEIIVTLRDSGYERAADWIVERRDPPREWVIGKVDVPGLAGPQTRIIAGPALGHREQVRVREVE